jgi:hypothetical protein
MNPKALLHRTARYVRRHPTEVVRVAANAALLRIAIPLDALRFFATQIPAGKRAPKDVEIDAAPPALRLSATVDAMGTALRASAAIRIEDFTVAPDAVRVTIRLSDVRLNLIGKSDSPVATLIQSGALDLSKPGNLLKFLPKKPPAIVEAEGDRIVLDLMKIPKLADNPRFKKALGVLSPVVGIRAIETDKDHLYVAFRATPGGVKDAIEAARA